MLKVEQTPVYADLRKNMMIASKLLKNKLSADSLPVETLTGILGYIIGKSTHLTDNMDLLRLEIEQDNMTKSKLFRAIKKNELYTLVEENEKKIFEETNSPFADILKKDISALPLSNPNNEDVNFDKFKDILFSLPFISDLLRASCAFNYLLHENFIRSLNNVKIQIRSIDSSKVSNFIFTKKYVKTPLIPGRKSVSQ